MINYDAIRLWSLKFGPAYARTLSRPRADPSAGARHANVQLHGSSATVLVHGITQTLFRVGRHLLRAASYRMLRARAFVVWNAVPYLKADPTWEALRDEPRFQAMLSRQDG